MSNFQQTRPLPSRPPSPDLQAIAALLHQAAQNLHSFSMSSKPNAVEGHGDNEKSSGPIEDGYARGEFHDELRCFRLPHYIVRQEYALLQQHKKEKFFHLLDSVYDDLYTTTLLMRNCDDSAHISGFELHLISDTLSRPLDLLSHICSQLADFDLRQKTIAPDEFSD